MSELSKALVEAQRIARAVEKESSNDFHRYKYASAEAMIAEARHALSQAGLAFSCVGSKLEVGEGFRILTCTYDLEHVSGETRAYQSFTPIIEERGRPLDKAVATAKTYDLGYTLRSLLLLPRVEEGTDVDQRDDRKHVPGKTSHMADVDLPSLTERILEAATMESLLELSNDVQALYKSGAITAKQRSELSKVGKARRVALLGLETKHMQEDMGPMPEGF